MISTPGIYDDISISDYVADPCEAPSLSASIASLLLERSPAHAFLAHPHLTPQQPEEWSAAANFGSAVHAAVFGGPKVHFLDAKDWRTKEAKEVRAAILKIGDVPLLAHEAERLNNIAEAVRRGIALTGLTLYRAEATICWQSAGTWFRTRPDVIGPDMRVLLDLKVTGVSARDPNAHFFSQGYDMQAAFMEHGADAIDPNNRGRRQIYYLFVEDEPPYAHRLLQLSEGTMMLARRKFNAATNLWRKCLATCAWPGYGDDIVISERPGWNESAWLTREMNDPAINVEALI